MVLIIFIIAKISDLGTPIVVFTEVTVCISSSTFIVEVMILFGVVDSYKTFI